jgi:sugar lactone lactonase YvrE
LIFKQKGSDQAPIGQITQGIDDAFGLFVDKQGDLYAANALNGTVTVYPPSSVSPSETLTGAGAPDNVVVGRNGSVYVSNIGNLGQPRNGTGTVLEYLKGKTTPSKTIVAFKTKGTYPEGLALDSFNNLYVAFDRTTQGSKPQGGVLEFTPGAPKGKSLGIHVDYALGLTIDKDNDLLLVDAISNCVDIFPPGKKVPSQQICGFPTSGIDGIALSHSNNALWVTGAYWSNIYGVTYPAGQIVDTISRRIGWAWGVATSPDGSD